MTPQEELLTEVKKLPLDELQMVKAIRAVACAPDETARDLTMNFRALFRDIPALLDKLEEVRRFYEKRR